MAITITDENFDNYFLSALAEYGKAQESESDVPTVTGAEAAIEDANYFSMPLIRNQGGIYSFAKVPLGGQTGLVQEIADNVASTGMMQTVTQEQFDAIFYPGGRSSSSD